MGTGKKLLALFLTAGMVLPPVQIQAEEIYMERSQSVAEMDVTEELQNQRGLREVTVPQPYYEFTFDGAVTDGKVENEGSKEGIVASISGNGQDLGIMEDEIRGNKVLNLPGGGLGKGSLILPDNMFADVTQEGFAFSFWINIDSTASQYSRIFSATPFELNSNDGDNGAWNAPEFTFVAGSETATDLGNGQSGYHTSIMLPDRNSQLKLVWERQFAKAKWQHVTISVSPTDYQVYLDGEKVNMTYDRNNNKSAILEKLFADDAAVLKTFTHNAIGRSVYSTDADLKAKMDEFRFYNVALTSEQAKAAYDSYAVRDSVIEKLQNKIAEAQTKSVSFYTRDSYAPLAAAIAEGLAGVQNPVTEANVNRLIGNLTTAIESLKLYEGVAADTTFSNAQLTKETAQAKILLSDGGLSTESQEQIQKAVTAAEQALTNRDQKTVDAALLALRDAVDAKSYGATLHFDADPENRKSELFHGSTGFLYGVSEIGVPSADVIKAIEPKILVQKAANGQQHPSGDGYRLTSYLKECGVENIQIYLQDYYLEWPYESNGIEDYNQKVKKIVTEMIEGKTVEEIAGYSFVIFNEPDGIWYQNKVSQMCTDWLKIYQTIKAINPAIKVAGPNFSVYNSSAYQTFFEFCQQNNCLPEYITWHELQKDKLTSFKSHCDEVRGYIKTYYAGSGLEPIIFVNETVNFDDVGNPGALVNWLAIFEEKDVYASLPYWGLANSLNELAADSNQPNGAWWVYKWYAQMTGKKLPLTLENIEGPGAYGRLYGLTSIDENAGMIYSLFGGQAGKQTISIENIRSSKIFAGADKAHVKLYSTKYTGQQGFADQIPVEFEGNLAFSGDDLVFTVPDAELMDAYYAVITPTVGTDVTTISAYDKNWEQTYEAENAALIGGAQAFTKTGGGDLARSNRAEVGGMNSENDGVKFTVEVPKDGRYRLNIYYSSQAPQVDPLTLQYVSKDGQNRAIGALCSHRLTIDGGAPQEIVFDSTVKWGYYNYKTVYVDLKAGRHEIQLMYQGENQNSKEINSMLCALLDKIDLTYAPKEAAVIEIEPEELAASQKGFVYAQEEKFSGGGSASGSGKFTFYVNVPRDGYYTVGSAGSGSCTLSKSRVNYAKDAKAESALTVDWLKLFDLTVGDQDAGMVYLTAGVNQLCLEGNGLVLDLLTFTENLQAAKENSIIVEAEDCQLSGTDGKDNYHYLPGSAAVPTVIKQETASGQKAVEGFRGGKDNKLALTVTAPEAGDYKLSVRYANDEPAPVMKTQAGADYVHPYNTDLVERYMQISVNGEPAQTVYFKNTFCWDTYKNTIIDVKLKKGENVIVFTNDNSYKFSSVQDDFSPRLDQFTVAPAKLTEKQEGKAEIPTITKQPTKSSYTYGQSAKALTIKASVKDGGTLRYQWYQNKKNSYQDATAVKGANQASYTPSTASVGTKYYYCVVTNTNQSSGSTKTAQKNSNIVSVQVTKAANKITGVASNLKKVYGSKAFTLKAKGKGSVTYTSSDKKVVMVGKKTGKVNIKGCGKAVITVKAAGNSNYKSGTKKIAVVIAPKKQAITSLKSTSKNTVTVKWKKDSKADGYQIQYGTNRKFKGAKTVKAKKSKTSVVLKKLKAKKRYYVRVRAYKSSSKGKVYGVYSKVKSVLVKR